MWQNVFGRVQFGGGGEDASQELLHSHGASGAPRSGGSEAWGYCGEKIADGTDNA
jgi:hypothetical protein